MFSKNINIQEKKNKLKTDLSPLTGQRYSLTLNEYPVVAEQ